MGRGDKLWLHDQADLEVAGRLVSLSPSTLVLDVNNVQRSFAESDVRLIRQRRSDPIWNGMAIGAAFGFAAGLAVGAPGCVFECPAFLGPPENQDFSWSDAMVGAALVTPMPRRFLAPGLTP